ncbi:MAG: hypothetical protein AB7W16_05490 [Candidatus Obscuribacterales bacterium]
MNFSNLILSLTLTVSILVSSSLPGLSADFAAATPEPTLQAALQAADVLNVRAELDRLQAMDRRGETYSREAQATRVYVYDCLLKGMFEVRDACNSIERELVFTYALMEREQARQQNVSDLFNLINFVQFGTLYTLEPIARMTNQFNTSGILTAVAAGNGIALPTANILYGKFSKTSRVAPPKDFRHIVSGNPVNQLKFPPLVEKFMRIPPPGSSTTRRQMLYSVWESRFGTRAMANDALHSLVDGKRKSIDDLNARIVHLWALHTIVQDLDIELLELTRLIVSDISPGSLPEGAGDPAPSGRGAGAAVKLMNIEREAASLARLNQSGDNKAQRDALEVFVIGKILLSSLEMRSAADRIYQELNYAYDVALAELERKRNKSLQLSYEANFMQINTFGAVASLLYLKDHAQAGNEMFVIGDSISLALSSLALFLTRGGKREIDTKPNSLADFFDLNPQPEFKFSPFVASYLVSPDPNSPEGLTHKQELVSIWKQNKVATVNYNKKSIQTRLAAMPGAKKDTIKILSNRVRLLSSLRVRLQLFDQQLLELLWHTSPSTRIDPEVPVESTALRNSDESSWRTARLIGAAREANDLLTIRESGASREQMLEPRLAMTRQILEAKLEVSKTVANIEQEIAEESAAIERLKRYRDMGVQMTNIANFYQIGVNGIIIDGILGLASSEKSQGASNKLNIVSGSMIIGLGALAYIQKPGGIRLSKTPANMLGPCLGIDSEASSRYAPLLLKFLQEEDPDSASRQTRAAQLLEFWKESEVIPIDVESRANQERLAAAGKHHKWWNERIKLIDYRIKMLFDLRSMVTLLEGELSRLITTVT